MFRKVTRSFGRNSHRSPKMDKVEVTKHTKISIDVSGDVQVDNSSSVLLKVATLYAEKLMNDLCLVVGSDEYPCHRLIVCASSDVFQAMLMNPQWSESSQSRVVLVETPECSQVFSDFLKYFYSGQIQISQKTVLPILQLADKYNVKDLVNICVNYMHQHGAQAALNKQLILWYQYTNNCQHGKVITSLNNYVKWNLDTLMENRHLVDFQSDVFINLLTQSDLVIRNESCLFSYAVQWLEHQRENIQDDEMEQLVVEVMSKIRFPMMSPRELADLLLCPLTTMYKEFFVERMAIGMSFHSGHIDRLKQFIAEEENGHLLFTPRLYTADTYSTLLTVENYPQLPSFHSRTLVFSSPASLSECEGDRVCEWVVDVYPKGVWFKKFFLIVWQGTVEVPEQVLTTVRLSVTCKDPPPLPSHIRVKVGILIYGVQDGVEHIMTVHEKIHHFSEIDRVLNIDDFLSFQELNQSAFSLGQGDTTACLSQYLVGSNRDVLKIHVVIQPLNDMIHRQSS